MSHAVAGQAPTRKYFELKSSSLTVPVLKLFDADIEAISSELSAQVARTPDFFQNAPIVIDLAQANDSVESVNLALLIGLVRGLGMLPVGVKGGDNAQNEAASMLELAVLGGSPEAAKKRAREAVEKIPEHIQPSVATARSMLIKRPVRSGQRIYAKGADLVIMAQVSSGAEIFADGNIHVYGALRGRAMAGIKGDRDARIFCKSLGAELVSIAGRYKVSENLSKKYWNESVQIYLNENRLVIEQV